MCAACALPVHCLCTACACFRASRCVPLFRTLAGYEADHNFTYDESQFLFMLSAVLDKAPTRAVLDRLTDAQVVRMVEAPHKSHAVENEEERKEAANRVQLRACTTCHAQEPALRTFMPCARCRIAVYCSTACQRKDWKRAHKSECLPCDQ